MLFISSSDPDDAVHMLDLLDVVTSDMEAAVLCLSERREWVYALLFVVLMNWVFRLDSLILSFLIDPGCEKHKAVPQLGEISSEWCQWALQNGGIIEAGTSVSSVDVKRLQDEKTGVLDGGGLCGAMMLRIKLTYIGTQVTGNEPTSMIAKLSQGGEWNFPFIVRLMQWLTSPGERQEVLYRNETRFIEKVLPLLTGSGYKHPQTYYTGIIDGGDRGLLLHVMLNAYCKVKAITLMEDMSGWRSERIGTPVSFDTAAACLRNTAILHAAFWGEKGTEVRKLFRYPGKAEQIFRLPAHSWITNRLQNNLISSVDSCRKNIDILCKRWEDTNIASFTQETTMPQWFTATPLHNGRFPVLKDPSVLEMLDVLSEKLPVYNKSVIQPFLERPVQTLLHGDFHCGNYMYGQGQNEGKIVALDFQHTGIGMVASEFVYLFSASVSPHDLDKIMELAAVYHEALLKHSVTDYSWNQYTRDVNVMFIEGVVRAMQFFCAIQPSWFESMALGISHEKGKDLLNVFESGFFIKNFLAVTSMYLEDKEGFMEILKPQQNGVHF